MAVSGAGPRDRARGARPRAPRLAHAPNAAKQALWLPLAGALLFAALGPVHWPAAAVMAVGAIAGGVVGGRFASRIRASTLRTLVVATGTVVGLIYLIRG
jgi:uncharacterized membrane protein YfcA